MNSYNSTHKITKTMNTTLLLLLAIIHNTFASSFCDEFLSKEIPQVVNICGFSEIIPYCCTDKHIQILKNFSDDFQILCEDTPEQQTRISNVTSNIERLDIECSKQPNLPDDFINNPSPSSSSPYPHTNPINLIIPLTFALLL